MKLIQCIIRQEKLPETITVLSQLVPGLTVSEVRGHGRQGGHHTTYRGTEYHLKLLPKVMIEVAIDDNKVDDVIEAIRKTAWTGEIGDGRIFITPIEEAYHVRTGFMEMD